MKYQANINQHFKFDLTDAEIQKLDVVEDGALVFNILQNNTSYRAEVVEHDFATKIFTIKINGRSYTLQLSDQYDQLVSKLGLEVAANNLVKDVKAPMPGLVLDVAVKAGQEVEKGDKLLILEAMKMENVIKSVGDGVIKAIHIDKGNAVDKGQLLIEME